MMVLGAAGAGGWGESVEGDEGVGVGIWLAGWTTYAGGGPNVP
jgi:hypothetical protein